MPTDERTPQYEQQAEEQEGKLTLNKDTLQDLDTSSAAGEGVRGGLDLNILVSRFCGGPQIPNIQSANIRCRPSEGPTCG